MACLRITRLTSNLIFIKFSFFFYFKSSTIFFSLHTLNFSCCFCNREVLLSLDLPFRFPTVVLLVYRSFVIRIFFKKKNGKSYVYSDTGRGSARTNGGHNSLPKFSYTTPLPRKPFKTLLVYTTPISKLNL